MTRHNMYYFKLYHDVFEDLKIRKFSIHEKFAWIAILTLASRSKVRGTIYESDEDIADYCEFNIKNDWLYFRDKLVAKGLIDLVEGGLKITKWEKCQTYDNKKPSDQPDATKKRKQDQRSREKEQNVTPCHADVTPCHALSHPDPDIDPDIDPNSDSDPDPDPDNKNTFINQEKEKKQEKKEIRNRSNSTEPNCEEPDLEISLDLNQKIACAEKPTFEPDLKNVPQPPEQTSSELTLFEPLEPVSSSLPTSLTKAKNKPIKCTKNQASDFEVFREVFNQDKPNSWARCEKLTEARIKKLKALVKEHGDRTIEVFQDALAFCRSDQWYSNKDFSIDNLLTNDKVTALAERSRASPTAKGGLGNELATEAARLAEFFREREQQNA